MRFPGAGFAVKMTAPVSLGTINGRIAFHWYWGVPVMHWQLEHEHITNPMCCRTKILTFTGGEQLVIMRLCHTKFLPAFRSILWGSAGHQNHCGKRLDNRAVAMMNSWTWSHPEAQHGSPRFYELPQSCYNDQTVVWGTLCAPGISKWHRRTSIVFFFFGIIPVLDIYAIG